METEGWSRTGVNSIRHVRRASLIGKGEALVLFESTGADPNCSTAIHRNETLISGGTTNRKHQSKVALVVPTSRFGSSEE